MTDLPIKATFKGGRDFDAPWITVDAANPTDLMDKVQGLGASGAVQAVVELANLFKSVNTTGPLLQDAPQQQPVQQQQPATPWGNPQAVQQQPGGSVQQQPQHAPAPQQNTSKYAGTPHPEGKTCEACPKVLEEKKTSSGKLTWRCPDWRWNNGNQNGHSSEWRN